MAHFRRFTAPMDYQILRPIASGGMGEVFEAIQAGAGDFTKQVAIKIIREEYSQHTQFRANFVGEARLVSDLIHTNIVQTYHLGEVNDRYFMVMEFVNGDNLETFLLQHRALGMSIPVDIAAFIVSRICRALAYAHTRRNAQGEPLNLVHRDVNPRNVLLASEGDIKLTDFGIAKARDLMYNQEGQVIAGKDEYLSPEQARREVTDARADLFSCGIILAEMVCGENIFEAENGEATRQNIEWMPLPDFCDYRDELEPTVEAILHRALRRDRDRRFQSAEEMLTVLERYLYSEGYGPTNEKFARYLTSLYADGLAFDDDRRERKSSFGLSMAANTP